MSKKILSKKICQKSSNFIKNFILDLPQTQKEQAKKENIAQRKSWVNVEKTKLESMRKYGLTTKKN